MFDEKQDEATAKSKSRRAWIAMGGSIELFEEFWPSLWQQQVSDRVLDQPADEHEEPNKNVKEN